MLFYAKISKVPYNKNTLDALKCNLVKFFDGILFSAYLPQLNLVMLWFFIQMDLWLKRLSISSHIFIFNSLQHALCMHLWLQQKPNRNIWQRNSWTHIAETNLVTRTFPSNGVLLVQVQEIIILEKKQKTKKKQLNSSETNNNEQGTISALNPNSNRKSNVLDQSSELFEVLRRVTFSA